MSEQDTGGFDFLTLLGLGAVIGAGLALFAGPKSSKELRKDVDKLRKEIEKSSEQLRNDLGKKSKRWKKEADKQMGKAGTRMRASGEDWLEEAEVKVGDLTNQLSEVVEDGVHTIRETISDELRALEKKLNRKKRRGLFR